MKRWTCWYWPTSILAPGSSDIPAPYARSSDDLNELREWARGLADAGNVDWVRVFASGDEHDERFRWERP